MKKSNTPNIELENNKQDVHELFEDSKEKIGELYDEGIKKICDIEEHLKLYSNELVNTVKKKPLTSLLVAGGIGFILSSLLKK